MSQIFEENADFKLSWLEFTVSMYKRYTLDCNDNIIMKVIYEFNCPSGIIRPSFIMNIPKFRNIKQNVYFLQIIWTEKKRISEFYIGNFFKQPSEITKLRYKHNISVCINFYISKNKIKLSCI